MVDASYKDILSSYKNYLSFTRKVSSATLSAYCTDINKFLNFLSEKYDIININDLNPSILLSYLLSLKEQSRASSSISRSMSVLRNFLLFCFHKNLIDTNLSEVKLEVLKDTKKLPETLTVEEINILLAIPGDTLLGYRDKAMLETLYTSGLKISELINLKVTDLDLKLKILKCVTKNNMRILPLGAIAQEAIENYLLFSRNLISSNNSEYLFLSYNGEKISRQGFWKLVKKYAKQAGIEKNISTSTFRHSFASHMIQNGINKEVLKETLGNSSVASVQMYLDLNRKRQKIV